MMTYCVLGALLAMGQTDAKATTPAAPAPKNAATTDAALPADSAPTPNAAPEAATDCYSSKALKQEPYCFCKRLLRGYPTLVDWFPKCLCKEPEKKDENKEEAAPEPERPRRA